MDKSQFQLKVCEIINFYYKTDMQEDEDLESMITNDLTSQISPQIFTYVKIGSIIKNMRTKKEAQLIYDIFFSPFEETFQQNLNISQNKQQKIPWNSNSNQSILSKNSENGHHLPPLQVNQPSNQCLHRQNRNDKFDLDVEIRVLSKPIYSRLEKELDVQNFGKALAKAIQFMQTCLKKGTLSCWFLERDEKPEIILFPFIEAPMQYSVFDLFFVYIDIF